jgi:hypothetical protein
VGREDSLAVDGRTIVARRRCRTAGSLKHGRAATSGKDIRAAPIFNVADGTVRGEAAHERKDTPFVFCLWSAPLSTIDSDLTYSDLSWNARRSARMSLSAKGTCLPHCVAIGFADGIAIAVI